MTTMTAPAAAQSTGIPTAPNGSTRKSLSPSSHPLKKQLLYKLFGVGTLIIFLSLALLVQQYNPQLFSPSANDKLARTNTTIAKPKAIKPAESIAQAETPTFITAQEKEKNSREMQKLAAQNTAAGVVTQTLPDRRLSPSSAFTSGQIISGKLYQIELGIYQDPAEAEALKARLQKAGIQANHETRLQLGPFSSLADVVKTQERLHKIGIQDEKVAAVPAN